MVSFIVGRYGEFVLLNPRLEMNTIVLWGAPFAVLLLAVFFLLARRRAVSAAGRESPLSGEEKAALDRLSRTGE